MFLLKKMILFHITYNLDPIFSEQIILEKLNSLKVSKSVTIYIIAASLNCYKTA